MPFIMALRSECVQVFTVGMRRKGDGGGAPVDSMSGEQMEGRMETQQEGCQKSNLYDGRNQI